MKSGAYLPNCRRLVTLSLSMQLELGAENSSGNGARDEREEAGKKDAELGMKSSRKTRKQRQKRERERERDVRVWRRREKKG